MKRTDRIKLNFTRNWNLPGADRLTQWFKLSAKFKADFKNGITWLNNEDLAIYTTADNYIEMYVLNSGGYESEINKLIKISLAEGETSLDIGANIGIQSLRMGRCVGPTGKVYAFEPLAHLREKFSNNILLNKAKNITIFPYALADYEGETDFTIAKNNWNQGTFSLNNTAAGTEKQKVAIKIADDLPEIKLIEKLALIKIDVEGFEFQVLRGLEQTLRKHCPRIIFEYDINYWVSDKQNIMECYDFLTDLNYTLYQIFDAGCELIKSAGQIESGNIFCMPAPNNITSTNE